MCPLDGTRGSARDQTHDCGGDSLARGGKRKTASSASRVDAALSLLLSLYVLRSCRCEPDWEVGRISTVGCNCSSFSCLVFHRPGGDWAGRALWALGKAPRRLEGNQKASGCQPNKWETACEAPHDASRSPLQPYAGGAAFLLTVAEGPCH